MISSLVLEHLHPLVSFTVISNGNEQVYLLTVSDGEFQARILQTRELGSTVRNKIGWQGDQRKRKCSKELGVITSELL